MQFYYGKGINKFRELHILAFIILISMLAGIVNIAVASEANWYFYFRDLFYFIQAPLYLLLGFQFQAKSNTDYYGTLKVIISAILLVTMYNFTKIITNTDIISNLGVASRYDIKIYNYSAIYGFVILAFLKTKRIYLFSKQKDNFIKIVFLISLILSFSRTGYASVLTMLLAPLIIKKNLNKLTFIALITSALFIIFGGSLFPENVTQLENYTFLDKIKHSLSEITVRNYTSFSELSDNWRGYESYLGLHLFYNGSFFEYLFGQGLSAHVQTPFWINFENDQLRTIPMFHNGYITILLKTGLLGLLLYFIFIYRLTGSRENFYEKNNIGSELLLALAISASIEMLAVHGFFSKSPSFIVLFLIGASLAYLKQQKTHTKDTLSHDS